MVLSRKYAVVIQICMYTACNKRAATGWYTVPPGYSVLRDCRWQATLMHDSVWRNLPGVPKRKMNRSETGNGAFQLSITRPIRGKHTLLARFREVNFARCLIGGWRTRLLTVVSNWCCGTMLWGSIMCHRQTRGMTFGCVSCARKKDVWFAVSQHLQYFTSMKYDVSNTTESVEHSVNDLLLIRYKVKLWYFYWQTVNRDDGWTELTWWKCNS